MKKIYYFIIGILLLFIITNPSIKSFKDFIGSNTYLGLQRTSNFFVCSVFSDQGHKYFGIAENFIDLRKKDFVSKATKDSIKKAMLDSVNRVDSSSRHHPYYISDTTADGLPIFKQK